MSWPAGTRARRGAPRRAWLIAAACVASAGSAAAVTAPAARAAAPSVIAPSAAVIEPTTGMVLYVKNGNVERGMASTTKLMTALVALGAAPLSTRYAAVNYRPTAAETRLGLIPGEKMTLADLVRAMMLPSANDAAQTVAVRTGGTKAKFVAMMNAEAKALGFTRTHYTNPVGLDAPTHRTTALELAKLGGVAFANPFLRATVKRRSITLTSGEVHRTITNRNPLLGTELPGGGVINGMKTGHTNAAGYSLVGSETTGGVTLISAVLGEPSEDARDIDSARLLRWASQLVVQRTLVRARQRVAVVPITHGVSDQVAAIAPKELRRVVAKGADLELQPVSMSPGLEAPVAAGTKVGVAKVVVNGKVVDTVPLVTRVAVERQGMVAAIVDGIGRHWLGGLVALLLVLGGTLTLVRARSISRPAPRPRASAPADPNERTSAP